MNEIRSNEKISKILDKLEEKNKESERFIEKYQTRKTSDLEEYYKGASWAFKFAIKTILDNK